MLDSYVTGSTIESSSAAQIPYSGKFSMVQNCLQTFQKKFSRLLFPWSKRTTFEPHPYQLIATPYITEKRPPDVIHVMNAPRPSPFLIFHRSSDSVYCAKGRSKTGEAWDRGYNFMLYETNNSLYSNHRQVNNFRSYSHTRNIIFFSIAVLLRSH